MKTDPMQSRDDLINYYCSEENSGKWVHVTSERGLVMKKFTGPNLHARHNLALKLVSGYYFYYFHYFQYLS